MQYLPISTIKLGFIFFFLFACCGSFYGQNKDDDCYQKLLREGINAYKVKDFELAKNKLDGAKVCKDTIEVDQWLTTVNNGYIFYLDSISKVNEWQARLAEANRLALLSKMQLENSNVLEALILSLESLLIIDTAKTSTMDLAFGEAAGKYLAQYLTKDTIDCTSFEVIPDSPFLFFLSEKNRLTILNYITKEKVSREFPEEKISPLSVSYSSGNILLAFDDNRASIVNLKGEIVSELEGHTESILFSHFSADGQFVLTCSRDNSIKVWNLDGSLIGTLEGHKGNVYQAFFHPNGNTIVSRSSDGSIVSWDIKTGKGKELAEGEYFLDLTLVPKRNYLLLQTSKGTIKVVSLEGQELVTLSENTQPIITSISTAEHQVITLAKDQNHVSLYNDQQWHKIKLKHDTLINGMVAFSNCFFTYSLDGVLKKWNAEGDSLQLTLNHPSYLVGVDFFPFNGQILTTTMDGRSWLWDRTGRLLMTIHVNGNEEKVTVFTPEGTDILGLQSDRLFLCPTPRKARKHFKDNPLPLQYIETTKKNFQIQSFQSNNH